MLRFGSPSRLQRRWDGLAWEVAILICCCPPRDRLRRSRRRGQIAAPATGQGRGLALPCGVLGPTGRLCGGGLIPWFQGVFGRRSRKPLTSTNSHTANVPSGSDLVPQVVWPYASSAELRAPKTAFRSAWSPVVAIVDGSPCSSASHQTWGVAWPTAWGAVTGAAFRAAILPDATAI
jgi:hypothetical protein